MAAKRLLATFALSILVANCGKDEPRLVGPVIETGNPSIVGWVGTESGKPAPMAKVRAYRSPASAADSTIPDAPTASVSVLTDSAGKFTFRDLAPGEYAIEAVDSSGATNAAALGIIARPDTTVQAHLYLDLPGAVAGRVTRGSNRLPEGITANEGILVRLREIDRFIVTDTSGYFSLENVPAGLYTLSLYAFDGHYQLRLIDSVEVVPGMITTFPAFPLLWSLATEPPAPASLRMEWNPDSTAIRLAWSPVELGNFSGFEIERLVGADSLAHKVMRTSDTVLIDTLPSGLAGQSIAYRIATANSLGNYSRKVLFGEATRGPANPDSQPPGSETEVQSLQGMVEDSRGRPAAGARIRVYAIPADTLTPDRPPKPVRLLDTGLCDAAGRFRFDSLPASSLSVVAESPDGLERAFHPLPADSGKHLDTAAADLRLAMRMPGTYGGRCKREGWVTSSSKADGDIQVSLEGTPFMAWTDADGKFLLQGIPPGRYAARFWSPPDGYFLPMIDSVEIRSGLESTDTLRLAFNPRIRPPKPQGLRVVSHHAVTGEVILSWNRLGFADLDYYEVTRRDRQGNTLFQSPALRDTVFADFPGTPIPAGTEIFYVIRCFDRNRVPSLFAGGDDGEPVPLRIVSP